MKKIILLGVVVFIVALLFKTPASLISKQISANSPLALSGVSGSLWEGGAKQANYGDIQLGELSWSLKPIGLLTGSAKGAFNIKGDELNANGDFSLSIGKTLTLDNTQFEVLASFINGVQKYGLLSGIFRGQIDHLEMQKTEPQIAPVIAAMINWEQGGLSNPIQLPQGNYQLKIEPESAGKLIGKISSLEAPVDIKGNIILDQNWQYQTDLKIKTTESGKSLQGMLSMTGRAGPDGYISVKESGNLFK